MQKHETNKQFAHLALAIFSFIIFIINTQNIFAEEKLQFMSADQGKYMYVTHKPPAAPAFQLKILRPLTEFKVGAKYCKHGTKNWGEECQDAAMEYAFGKNWMEFKRVALAFVEGMRKDDNTSVTSLLSFPFAVSWVNKVHDDGSYGYTGECFGNIDDFAQEFGGWYDHLNNKWRKWFDSIDFDLRYEDFFLFDLWKDGYYVIALSKAQMYIMFDMECENNKESHHCHYFPEISNFIF
jgi:hypothetical protein